MPSYVAPTLQQVRDEFAPSILRSSQLAASLLQIVLDKASEAERSKLLPLLEHGLVADTNVTQSMSLFAQTLW